MASLAQRPTDSFDDFCERQVARIHRKAERALNDSRKRRQQRLKETYFHMEAEARIGVHATGPKKPNMDGMR